MAVNVGGHDRALSTIVVWTVLVSLLMCSG